MAKKPPRARRRVNGDISVDLRSFLTRLARATDWEGDVTPLGEPGSYVQSAERGCCNPARYAVDYLFREIMTKFDDKSKQSDSEKTERSLAKFREAEGACRESNEYFAKIHFYPEWFVPPDTDPDVWQAMCLARRKIAQWLGPFDWNEAARGFRFTGGASARMPRTRSAPAHKYSGKLEITPDAESLALAALQLYPTWGPSIGGGYRLKYLDGNKILCVPKNYKVHRTIAAEPSGNMFFQKGIGSVLRRRLQAIGVDLRSQAQNQDWCYFGSVTGLVATIDLSMASDTVSKGIVEWAIPPDWVEAMSLCRSPKGEFASGEQVLYRKWSSMGNAYTFELETMLFYGLAWASARVSGHDTRFLAAYGDDIVCPTGASDLLIRVLRRCGFVPNEEKSFVSGPFRESCGKHYYRGTDVTPFYIRSQPRKLTDLFLLVNNLVRWVRRVSGVLPEHCVDRVMALCKEMRSIAPSEWRRPRIPDNNGDGAFIGTFDECLPRRPRGKWLWFEGWQVEVIADVRERISCADASEYLTEAGVMLAMLESQHLGHVPDDDDTSWWYKDLLDRCGGVVPNRRRQYRITTKIVTQF